MFDKYLCRKIGKKEITIEDILRVSICNPDNWNMNIIAMVDAVSIFLIIAYAVYDFNSFIQQLFNLRLIVSGGLGITLAYIFVYLNLHEKVIAVCPLKKR